MALWKPFRGNRNMLDAVEKHDGYVYFCIDDGSLFFDHLDSEGNLQRKQINAKEAESLTGYSISTVINSSNTEIPTSQAIENAINNITADDLGIYVQATEPTDAEDGAIWIDTSSDPTFTIPHVPTVTEADNGKVLMVVNGSYQLVTLNMSVDANGVLSV